MQLLFKICEGLRSFALFKLEKIMLLETIVSEEH